MTDLRAGTTVRALDFPPTVQAGDGTLISNITSTVYLVGSPEVGTTFMAPTSGRVKLITSLVARDNGGDNTVYLTPQVYLGTSASGTQIVLATIRHAVSTMGEASNYQSHERVSFLDGLTPGSTYYIRVGYRVSGGTTADLTYRGIIVVPLT